jgi:hypothetical protein
MTGQLLLELEDRGQDFTWFLVEPASEGRLRIVNCGPFQMPAWVGKHLIGDTIAVGRKPSIELADHVLPAELLYPIVNIDAAPDARERRPA